MHVRKLVLAAAVVGSVSLTPAAHAAGGPTAGPRTAGRAVAAPVAAPVVAPVVAPVAAAKKVTCHPTTDAPYAAGGRVYAHVTVYCPHAFMVRVYQHVKEYHGFIRTDVIYRDSGKVKGDFVSSWPSKACKNTKKHKFANEGVGAYLDRNGWHTFFLPTAGHPKLNCSA